MSRTWIRNATLLTAAAVSASSGLGIDLASGLSTSAQGAYFGRPRRRHCHGTLIGTWHGQSPEHRERTAGEAAR